jgi:hypothetical protein
MHIGDIKALAKSAHDDAGVRERLFATLLGAQTSPSATTQDKEAVNAAWALTHLPKEDNIYINMYRAELVQLALITPEVPLRRLSMVLLERLDWGRDDVRTDLLDFCLEHMMLADESYGVRALCMKLAYRLSLPYPELLGELRRSLLLLEPSELGAGVRCTRKNLLKILTP